MALLIWILIEVLELLFIKNWSEELRLLGLVTKHDHMELHGKGEEVVSC